MPILLSILLMILTPVVSNAKDIPQNNKPYGGALVWGVCNKPTIINPVLTTHSVSASLLDLIFNRLVRLNSKGEIAPDLAESWEISSDGLVYTFHLRKGVKFHDGIECTADDIKFTYDKVTDPQINSPYAPSFESVEEFKAIDKYTFQIKLKQPSVTFIYRLVREIAPKHILEKSDIKDCSFNFHPIGTGPFKFKEWAKDDQIILEYNPGYYEGRPYLDKIIVKLYPDYRDAWIALMRSEVDLVIFIEKEDYEIAKNDPAFKTYSFPVDYYYAVFYNPDDPVLSDIPVRKAIAYGIDRKSLIEKIGNGDGVECHGPFFPRSLGYNPEILPFEYAPDKAGKLLTEAGWQDKNNDGILEKNGEELEIKLLVDTKSELFKRMAMFIRQQLQEIGIRLKVKLYDDESILIDEFLKKNKPQAQLKLFFGGVDSDEKKNLWSHKGSQRENKLYVYKNEDVATLFDLVEVTQDNKKKHEIYQRAHKMIYADQPACFLYFPYVFFAVSAKFENTDEYFTLDMPTYTIKDWYVAEPKKNRMVAKMSN